MKPLGLQDLAIIREFTRRHFADLARFSITPIVPSSKNFMTWFNLEIYPFLRDGTLYPIHANKELIGYVAVDLSPNKIYELREKLATVRSLYVKPDSRGNIAALKTVYKLYAYLQEEGYTKIYAETSTDNGPMNRIFHHLKGKVISQKFGF